MSEYETGAIDGVEDTDDGATDPDALHDADAGVATQGADGKRSGRGRPLKSTGGSPATPTATAASVASLPQHVQQMLMKLGIIPSELAFSHSEP